MKSLFVLALAALLLPLRASAQETLSLQATLDRVLAHYPSLDAAQAAIDAARARTVEARAAQLPQVSANGSYLFTTPRPFVEFSLPTGTTSFYQSTQNAYNAGVTGRQLLTDFGRTHALVDLARTGELSAQDALDAARNQLGYQTIQAFYSVLLLRQSVNVADEEITALNEALRISNRKFSGGTATKFDVLTTQVRLANAQNARTDTQAALEKQEALLRQLVGGEPTAAIAIAGEFPAPSPAPALNDAIAAGLANRPEMKLAKDSERSADERLTAAQRGNRPELSAQATGGVQNGQLPSLYANRGFFAGGLNVTVPLFTGKRLTGEREEARAGIRSAQAQIAELDRKIATEVADSLADLRAAAARLQNADLLVDQAKEALALARTRYTNGVITNFELLDAQSASRNAELTRLQARFDWTLARQALAQASGDAPRA